MIKRRTKPPITKLQKKLLAKLLCGCFLRQFSRPGRTWYVLYDIAVNPLEKVSTRLVDKMDRFVQPDIKIWKKDRHGNITLNLSMVRRIDGRNPIKKMYKRRHELGNPGAIHQLRRRAKKTDNNENSNLLF